MKKRRKKLKNNRKTLYQRLVMLLAYICVFFRVVCSKERYRRAFIGLLVAIGAIVVMGIVIIKNVNNNSAEESHDALRENYLTTASDNLEVLHEDQVSSFTSEHSDEVSTIENVDDVDTDPRFERAVWSMEQDADENLWYGKINVDLNGLREVNDDIIGWIYFEAADISYPVLYSGDDEAYLRTSYDGKYQTAGSIFLEGVNNPDFSDKHVLIYGHNMRNLTMFGQLKLYKTEADYYKNHQYFQLFHMNDDGKLIIDRYHIFACKDVSDEDDIYYVFDKNYLSLSKFVDDVVLKNNILKDADLVVVTNSDQVVTLSTCSSNDNRFVVSAVKCATCQVGN